jgi:hypothetical protein
MGLLVANWGSQVRMQARCKVSRPAHERQAANGKGRLPGSCSYFFSQSCCWHRLSIRTWSHRGKLILEQLERIDADIILLQVTRNCAHIQWAQGPIPCFHHPPRTRSAGDLTGRDKGAGCCPGRIRDRTGGIVVHLQPACLFDPAA